MENNNINDLRIIKKKYGEKMMHLCKELFPTIIAKPGTLSKILLSTFEPSRFLYDDIIQYGKKSSFRHYINSFVDKESKERVITDKTPYELLSDAGYYLYECKTEADIGKFKKYYQPGREMLCTFNDNRLKKCYVFFAVKKNVDSIKREDFPNPTREDEYGTSVISIQFSRGDINFISIKNRYNTEVEHADSTFDNDLDNIILGLTESFKKAYKFNFEVKPCEFSMPYYEKARNGKYYKYNYMINDICYGPNNVIIHKGKVIDKYLENEKYLLIDYFIIDLVNKTITLYDESIKDSFVDSIKYITDIKIKKTKKDRKSIEITCAFGERITIVVDSANRIIKYYNESLRVIDNSFMTYNTTLKKLYTPNVEIIGDDCLTANISLTSLILNKVRRIGKRMLKRNEKLNTLLVPSLEYLDDESFENNTDVETLFLEKAKVIGNRVLVKNKKLTYFYAPNLEKTGSYFLFSNLRIKVSLMAKSLKEQANSIYYSNIANVKKMSEESKKELATIIQKASYQIREYKSKVVNEIEGVHKR